MINKPVILLHLHRSHVTSSATLPALCISPAHKLSQLLFFLPQAPPAAHLPCLSSDASLGAGVAIESAVTARVVGVVVIGVVRVVVAVVGEEGIVVREVIREVGFLLLEFAGELR